MSVIEERYIVVVGGCDDVFGRAEMLKTIEILDCKPQGYVAQTYSREA